MKRDQLKAGVILSYMAMGVQGITLLIYTPLVIRLLGKSEYGIYELATSVVGYLGILSFGFGSAYTRFYYKLKKSSAEDAIAKLNGMFMIAFSIIAVIALLAGGLLLSKVEYLFAKGLTETEIQTTKKLMAILIFNIAITFPNSVFESYLIAKEQYIFQRGVALLQAIFNPFMALILLIMGMKSFSLVIVTTILTVGKFFLNMWYCLVKMRMHFKFRQLQLALFREVGVFSFYIFLNIITDQINWAVDKTLLAALVNSSAVAVYGAASQINQGYLSLSTSVSTVFAPRVNRMVVEEDEDLNNLFVRVGRIQFLILGLILFGFFLVGKYFVFLWLGKGYEETYQIVLLLIIPVTVPLIQNLGVEIQKARNLHKFRSVAYVLVALGNVIISIPLIKWYGATGAALGTAMGMLIGNVFVMNWYYHKIQLNIGCFWKEISKLLPGMLGALVIGIILRSVFGLNSITDFVIVGGGYVASYIVLMWYVGLNNFEKNLVKELIGRK